MVREASNTPVNPSGGLMHGVWQLPYVNVFKKCGVFDGKNSSTSGDVKIVMDKHIKKRCFRVRGLISAANFVAVQHLQGSTGLELTGEYCMLQMRSMLLSNNQPNNFQTFHVDVNTSGGSTGVRLSFSNLFKEPKVVGHIAQLPFIFRSAQWHVVSLHLPSLVKQYFPKLAFSSIKAIKLCSNLFVRNVLTSANPFTFNTLPRDAALPVTRNQNWEDRYEWLNICGDGFIPLSPTVEGKENVNSSIASQNSINQSTAHTLADDDESLQLLTQISSAADRDAAIRAASGKPPAKAATPSKASKDGPKLPRTALQALSERYGLDETAAPEYPVEDDVPTMSLRKVVGFSVSPVGHSLLWAPDGRHVVFAASTLVVFMDTVSGEQIHLSGHTAPVTELCFSQTGLLATGQSGNMPLIRVWDVSSFGSTSDNQSAVKGDVDASYAQENKSNAAMIPCLAVLRGHHHGLASIAFSKRAELLTAAGKDHHDRFLLVVWNITEIHNQGQAVVVGKQLSEFNIRKVVFAPYDHDPYTMVTCGDRSIRFWRLANRHLPASSLSLEQHSKNTFTDLAFEAKYGEADITKKRLFVSTASGAVFQVNYEDRTLECIFQLHNGPIHSLAVNEGFCVTASEDRFLRVWPLDFSDYYLQAQHKDAVVGVSISLDGLKVAVGTGNGSVGVLDLASTAYRTVLRSHTAAIHAVAPDPRRKEFATVGADGTVRVWNSESLQQVYEFFIPNDEALCVAYHPSPHDYKLAVGFASGAVRILDVTTTSLFVDYQQHECDVYDIVFSPAGDLLFSNSADGNICVYDVAANYQPLRMFTCYRAQISGDMNSFNPATKAISSPYKADKRRSTNAISRASSTPASSKKKNLSRSDVAVSVANNSILSNSNASDAGFPSSTTILVKKNRGARSNSKASHLELQKVADGSPHALVVSPDGTFLATIGADGTTIILIETHELKEVKRFNSYNANVAALAFPPGRDELLAVLVNGRVQRYSLSTGRLVDESVLDSLPAEAIATSHARTKQEKHGRPVNTVVTVTAIALTRAGLLAVADSSGIIQLANPFANDDAKTHKKNPSIFDKGGVRKLETQKYLGHYVYSSGKHPDLDTTVEGLCFHGNNLLSVGGESVHIWQLVSGGDNEDVLQGGPIATPEKLLPEPAAFEGEGKDLADDLNDTSASTGPNSRATSRAGDTDADESKTPAASTHMADVVDAAVAQSKEELAAKVAKLTAEAEAEEEAERAKHRGFAMSSAKQEEESHFSEEHSQVVIPTKLVNVTNIAAVSPPTGEPEDAVPTLPSILGAHDFIGYSGSGRGNVAWNAKSGVMAYALGARLVLDSTAAKVAHRRFVSMSSPITSLALTGAGDVVACGCTDGSVVFVTVSSATVQGTVQTNAAVQSLAFSATGEFMAVVATTSQFINPNKKTQITLISVEKNVVVASRDVLGAVFEVQALPEYVQEEEEPSLFTASHFVTIGSQQNQALAVWSIEDDGKTLQSIPFNTQEPFDDEESSTAFDFSSDEDAYENRNAQTAVAVIPDQTGVRTLGVVVGTQNGYLRLFDAQGNLLCNYRTGKEEVAFTSFAWAGGESAIIVAATAGGHVQKLFIPKMSALDGIVGCFTHGRVSQSLMSLESDVTVDGAITALATSAPQSSSHAVALVGTTKNALYTCVLTTGKVVPPVRLTSSPITSTESKAVVQASAWHPREPYLATGASDGSLSVFRVGAADRSDTVLAMLFDVKGEEVTSVAFNPSPHRRNELVAGYSSGAVRLFNVDSLNVSLVLPLSTHVLGKGGIAVTSITYMLGGDAVVCGMASGDLILMDQAKKELFKFTKTHSTQIRSLDVSPVDSSALVAVDDEDNMSAWSVGTQRLRSGDLTFAMTAVYSGVMPGGRSSVVWSTVKNHVLIAPEGDHVLFVMDVSKRHVVVRQQLATHPVSIALSHQGKYITVLNADGSIAVMSFDLKSLLQTAQDDELPLTDLSYFGVPSDGNIIVSGQYGALAGQAAVAITSTDGVITSSININL